MYFIIRMLLYPVWGIFGIFVGMFFTFYGLVTMSNERFIKILVKIIEGRNKCGHDTTINATIDVKKLNEESEDK